MVRWRRTRGVFERRLRERRTQAIQVCVDPVRGQGQYTRPRRERGRVLKGVEEGSHLADIGTSHRSQSHWTDDPHCD